MIVFNHLAITMLLEVPWLKTLTCFALPLTTLTGSVEVAAELMGLESFELDICLSLWHAKMVQCLPRMLTQERELCVFEQLNCFVSHVSVPCFTIRYLQVWYGHCCLQLQTCISLNLKLSTSWCIWFVECLADSPITQTCTLSPAKIVLPNWSTALWSWKPYGFYGLIITIKSDPGSFGTVIQ